jgi:hypothetical protein
MSSPLPISHNIINQMLKGAPVSSDLELDSYQDILPLVCRANPNKIIEMKLFY